MTDLDPAACRCERCGASPTWVLLRHGDAVVTWADDLHLADVLTALQRDFEITEVSVRDFQKSVDWADIARALDRAALDNPEDVNG